jgi:hypothetical protein
MLKTTLRRPWQLVALGLLALVLASCDGPETVIVGTWKGRGAPGPARDVAEFSADGTCKLSRGGTPQACAWGRGADGNLSIRYGTGRPTTTVLGAVSGDELWLLRGDHTESSWIRKGSRLDSKVTDFTKVQKLVQTQTGDSEPGTAALKDAAPTCTCLKDGRGTSRVRPRR